MIAIQQSEEPKKLRLGDRVESTGGLIHYEEFRSVHYRDRNNNARDNDNDRNRNRGNDDKKYESNKADFGKLNSSKIDVNDLPRDVRSTIRDNMKGDEKISEAYKVKTDEGGIHYVVKTSDDRTIRVGEHGGLLGQTR